MRGRKIEFVGFRPKRWVARYINAEMGRWLEAELGQASLLNVDYLVRIEREEGLPFFECSVDVEVGSTHWHARENGKSFQAAIEHALKRIRVQSTPARVVHQFERNLTVA